MSAIWTKTIINLRKFAESGQSYSLKAYHDKVVRLKSGRPSNFTDKEAKLCLTKDVATALASTEKFIKPLKAVAQSKYTYETKIDDAASMEAWVRAKAALIRKGAKSSEYSKAMASYVEVLRQRDSRLGYDVDEIQAFLPHADRLLAEANLSVRHGQALSKFFQACAKEPKLKAHASKFAALSADCTAFLKNAQMISRYLASIQAECKKQLPIIKEKKKVSYQWYQAAKKKPPQDVKTMEKNTKAKKPSF